MCASLSTVSPNTAPGVETCVPVSWDSHPSGTDGKGMSCGSHVKACPQFPFHFLWCGQHVCTSFFFNGNAWICARRTTGRDLQSLRHEKVSAWTCARPTTNNDLVSVITENKKENEKEKNANL